MLDFSGKPKQLTFQVGARSGDALDGDIDQVGVDELALNDFCLHSQPEATKAIRQADTALGILNAQRSMLGARINGLHNQLSVAQNTEITTGQARSIIQDADIAKESLKLAKDQILQQTSFSMISETLRNAKQVRQLLLPG